MNLGYPRFIDDAGTFTYSGQGAEYNGSTDGRIVDGQSDAGALNVSMWSNNTDAAATKGYTNTLASNVNVAANASEALLDGEMIVIPQSVTAASAYAAATADAAVNGSYVGIKLKILNRENDAVIYSDGAATPGTAWAIWPADFAFEPGKKYTFTVDLCGGGYYEANHDTDADLDPILQGAVISFVDVTVDDFSSQTAINLPVSKITPRLNIGVMSIDVGQNEYATIWTNVDTIPYDIYLDGVPFREDVYPDDGRIQITITSPSAGSHTITVQFDGDENYNPVSESASFTVGD